MYCSKCGKQIKEGSKFCVYCGVSLEEKDKKPEQTPKKKNGNLKKEIVIAVLAFMAGSAVTYGYFKSNIAGKGADQETIYAHAEKNEDAAEEDIKESTEESADETISEIVQETESTAGWKQTEYGWWYDNGDGSCTTNGWQNIDGNWYCFNESGYMRTGWIISDGNDYYCNPDGTMAVNTWIDGMYYVGSDGAMYRKNVTPDGYKIDKNGKAAGSIGPMLDKNEYLGVYDEWGFTGLGSCLKITAISEDRIQGSYVSLEYAGYADFDVPLRENQFEIRLKGVTLENIDGEIEGWIGENGETYTEKFALASLEGQPAMYYMDNLDYMDQEFPSNMYQLKYDTLANDERFEYTYSMATGDYWR